MSDLVAVDATDVLLPSTYNKVEGGDYSGLAQFYPGGDEAVKAATSFAEGDWASGAIALAGLGAEAIGMAIDPIATLASSVAGFLLDYMPPLPSMLDALAGNPGLVEAIGDTWVNIGTAVEGAANDLQSSLATLMGSWTGLAGQAYAAACGAFVDALFKAAHVCRCMGQALQVASGVVEAVRGLTKEIIAELVGRLISWAAQVAGTFGIGASWVIPQATAGIADTTTDVVRLSDVLVDAIKGATGISRQLDDVLNALLMYIEQINEGRVQGQGAGDDTE